MSIGLCYNDSFLHLCHSRDARNQVGAHGHLLPDAMIRDALVSRLPAVWLDRPGHDRRIGRCWRHVLRQWTFVEVLTRATIASTDSFCR